MGARCSHVRMSRIEYMRSYAGIVFSLALTTVFVVVAGGQQASKRPAAPKAGANSAAPANPSRDNPLVFTEAIPLQNAKGRFDHFAMGGGKLFVAALGSNAVEVIDIGGRILDHVITGV